MKRVKWLALLLCLAVLSAAFVACRGKEPFDNGTPITPDGVGDLKTEIGNGEQTQGTGGTDQPSPDPVTPGDETTGTEAPEITTVYWLPNGSVYHDDSTCYHIKGKTNVQSGTVTAANEAGKARLCSACAD